ncbi:YkgJ family cysteine cluster protein [Burkholderia sp. L27(2015)]|jgi:Fe-S-cluster containining protein|uniref:YkgJ family cysteine cluster protein n=1 Tax=Burkholderia sp. L27(2015) TaxID=1641858 RepID=UPI00349ED06E
MRCGIYEQRPLVCRIYPAEISPFVELTPMHKACPPDAWTPGLPPLLRAGKLVDAGILPLIQPPNDGRYTCVGWRARFSRPCEQYCGLRIPGVFRGI